MSTLLRPPPDDPNLSVMENTLELRHLSDIDPNLFTNLRPLWHPPGARGVYGGAMISQCLSAAQRTVRNDFTVHSMHCYFVLAGSSEIPIIFHVERVREGRSFATRTVQARQRGAPIFTTTLSFMRTGSAGEETLDHDSPLPEVPSPEDVESPISQSGPFETIHLDTVEGKHKEPHLMRTRMWIRARGPLSEIGGHEAHLNALAYMTDSFFIGTVGRAHRTYRRIPSVLEKPRTPEARSLAKRAKGQDGKEEKNIENRPEIGMMVSLDHTIYFHRPREFRADEWLLSESHSPWSGDGRGFVTQKIWTKDGRLVATCFQEGLVRLKQDGESKL